MMINSSEVTNYRIKCPYCKGGVIITKESFITDEILPFNCTHVKIMNSGDEGKNDVFVFFSRPFVWKIRKTKHLPIRGQIKIT